MNQYITGKTIRQLREDKNLTQKQLSELICVSEKTISKWETGKGFPDITLLEPLSKVLNISINELITGDTVFNSNVSANILKSNFYICPICGNIIHSMGESLISCHGITLPKQEIEPINSEHDIKVEKLDGEYFVSISHPMTKTHYISFICAVTFNNIQFVKLYPESSPEAYFSIRGVKKIYFYCNKDGLFKIDI